MSEEFQLRKVCIVGPQNSGKTMLFNRLFEGIEQNHSRKNKKFFTEHYARTRCTDLATFKCEENKLRLIVMDIPECDVKGESYWFDPQIKVRPNDLFWAAVAIIIVIDLSNSDNDMSYYESLFLEKYTNIPKYVIGTKADDVKEGRPEFTIEFAQKINATKFILYSAKDDKDGIKLKSIFNKIGREINDNNRSLTEVENAQKAGASSTIKNQRDCTVM